MQCNSRTVVSSRSDIMVRGTPIIIYVQRNYSSDQSAGGGVSLKFAIELSPSAGETISVTSYRKDTVDVDDNDVEKSVIFHY
jgi:hypothetical protein